MNRVHLAECSAVYLLSLFTCVLVAPYLAQDPEKGPVPAFQPFQRSISTDEEQPEVKWKLNKVGRRHDSLMLLSSKIHMPTCSMFRDQDIISEI